MDTDHWCIVICFVLITICSVCCGGTPNEDQVLNMLRQTDSVYTKNGFTVAGDATEPPNARRPGQPAITRNWRMTFQDGIGAITYEAVNPSKGVFFVEPGSSPYADYDGSGNCFVGVRTIRKVYCDSSRTAMYTEELVHIISPENVVLKTGVNPRARLSDPGLTGAGRYIKEILWSVGRGFSQFIDEVITVEEQENGKLLVVAKGKQSDVYFGNWHLVIEPEAAWMVRHATFYHEDSPKVVDLEIVNTGLTWDGPLAMPDQTAVNYGGPITNNEKTLAVVFAEISTGLDESFLNQVDTETQPPFENSKTKVLLERRGRRMLLDIEGIRRNADEDVLEELGAIDTGSLSSTDSNVPEIPTINSPSTSSILAETRNSSQSARRSVFILPKWLAYCFLALGLAGISFLSFVAHKKAHKDGRSGGV